MKPRKWKLVPIHDPKWYFIICVFPGKEMSVRKQLAKKAIFNFTPMRTDRVVVNRAVRIVSSAMFTGYVFVSGDHYKKFKVSTYGLRNFINIINVIEEYEDENGEMQPEPEVYRMNRSMIKHMVLCQEAGYFDFTKEVNRPGKIFVGDVVDVVGDESNQNLVLRGVRVIGLAGGKATIIAGNRISKIKLCFLKKLEDK